MTATMLKPAPFSRSRSSDSSASSLSSTFSDIIPSSISDSSSTSKTNAFFASPFSTRPPSPIQPEQKSAPPPTRSITADFFATPVRPPSPPTTTTTTTTTTTSVKRQPTIHPSRIFPSRYTSTVDHSPDFVSLDVTLSPTSHERSPSSESDSSFTSFVETRLPTPPPPPASLALPRLPFTTIQGSKFESSSNEPTPRPPDLEPALLHFERSLLLVSQENQKRKHHPQPEPESELISDDDGEVEEEPHTGSVISLNTEHHHHPIPRYTLSPFGLSFASTSLQDDRGTPTPTNELSSKPLKSTSSSAFSSLPTSPSTWDDHESTPTLRLLRTLAHGAFSTVWLAEDLSHVPLTLVSRKSVRDLRRRVSGRDKKRREEERERDKEIEILRDEEGKKQADQVELTIDGTSSKEVTKLLERPPTNLRDGFKSMLSLSRLPTLPFSGSCTDGFLSKSPLNMDPSPWNSYDLPSSTSLHQDTDLDMDSLDLSLTSSIRSSSSYSPISHQPSLELPSRDDSASLSRDSSLKKFRDRVRGTRPAFRLGRAYLDERHGEMGWKEGGGVEGEVGDDEVGEKEGGHIHLGPNLYRHPSLKRNSGTNGRLVAVKMTPRKVRGAKGRRERAEEERTRVGFVREVEVLKHISHPNITPLLAHLSISTHHILVLPYLSGGDLLGLVNNDVAWGKLGESVLKRIWCELCKAVGWMHGVGLVHRDIKLENILLTTPAFNSLTPTSPPPTSSCLPTPPSPLIKLTDFGLSRFVEIDVNGEAELLWTRCGSEAYAAPELVTGGGGGSGGASREGRGGESGGRGVYDARKTDAWACGVVLYALVARHLPFGEGVGAQPIGGGSRIGGGRSTGRGSLAERRHWLMRIARGEYEWPGDQEGLEESQSEVEAEKEKEKDELVGSGLIHSQGARRIVGRLLIRDPRKRARIGDLWDDSWMTLSGGGDEVWWKEREKGREQYDSCFSSMITRTTSVEGSFLDYGLGHEDGHEAENSLNVQGRIVFDQAEVGVDSLRDFEEGEEGGNGEEEEEEEDGCLFDHEGIDSITRQEVV